MNVVDLCIVLIAISGAILGWHWGLLRQLMVSVGLIAGLIGAVGVCSRLVRLPGLPVPEWLIVTVLGGLILFLCIDVAVSVGGLAYRKLASWSWLHKIDGFSGTVLGILTTLVLVWFMGPVLRSSPLTAVNKQMNKSRLLTTFAAIHPGSALDVMGLARFLQSSSLYGPQLFVGNEPTVQPNAVAESPSALKEAVNEAEKKVVKVWGDACGKSSIGSGFVVADRLVATNAHVVAGMKRPQIESYDDSHAAKVVWFDVKADIALLRTSGDLGGSLEIDAANQPQGAVAAMIGFPGGGSQAVTAMVVIDVFEAKGLDIYGKRPVLRKMYAMNGKMVPGNSGGPIIDEDGQVIAMVIGHSLSQEGVGYALAVSEITRAITVTAADIAKTAVSTGECI